MEKDLQRAEKLQNQGKAKCISVSGINIREGGVGTANKRGSIFPNDSSRSAVVLILCSCKWVKLQEISKQKPLEAIVVYIIQKEVLNGSRNPGSEACILLPIITFCK